MANQYKDTVKGNSIIRVSDGYIIPKVIGNADYDRFLIEGVVLLPADPDPAPVDYSDSNNIDKTLQALMLCIAQVGGLTIPQAKALFKSKFNLLP